MNYYSLYFTVSRNFIKKALGYVRRSAKIFDANLSAWDLPYNEYCIANIKHKESVLLKLLESKCK